MAGIIRPRPQY